MNIGNPKIEVPATLEMNDRDYVNAMLETEKNMSNNLSVALNEASNNELYNSYFDMFEDIKDAARVCYDLMFEKGWYQLEGAEETKIEQKLQELKEQYNELNNGTD